MAKRRVLLCGSSLHLEGVRASLQPCAGLDVTSVEADGPDALQSILARHPDVVVFDSSGGKPDWVLELAHRTSAVVLIGIDPAKDHALVLSSRRPKVQTMQDLVQAINASPVSANPPSLAQVGSARLQRLASQINLMRYPRTQKLAFALVAVAACTIVALLIFPTGPQANVPLAGTVAAKLAPDVGVAFVVGILLGALFLGLFVRYERHANRGNAKDSKEE